MACIETINGLNIAPKDAVRAFATVADMQAATDLAADMTCHTNGFHEEGDGGAAYYTVSTEGTANGMDVLACEDGLKAVLVFTQKNQLNAAQLGINNGSTAESINDAISLAASKFNGFEKVGIEFSGEYTLSGTINVDVHKVHLYGNANFLFNGVSGFNLYTDTTGDDTARRFTVDALSGFRIKGNSNASEGTYGVLLGSNSSRVKISNCVVTGFGHGVSMPATTESSYMVAFDNCYIFDNYVGACITPSANSGESITFNRCQLNNNSTFGVKCASVGVGVKLVNCSVDYNGAYSLYAYNSAVIACNNTHIECNNGFFRVDADGGIICNACMLVDAGTTAVVHSDATAAQNYGYVVLDGCTMCKVSPAQVSFIDSAYVTVLITNCHVQMYHSTLAANYHDFPLALSSFTSFGIRDVVTSQDGASFTFGFDSSNRLVATYGGAGSSILRVRLPALMNTNPNVGVRLITSFDTTVTCKVDFGVLNPVNVGFASVTGGSAQTSITAGAETVVRAGKSNLAYRAASGMDAWVTLQFSGLSSGAKVTFTGLEICPL